MSTENGVNPLAPNHAYNSNFSLLSVLGRKRLTGPNYMDWMRNLRFTLRTVGSKIDLEEIQKSINEEPVVKTDTQQEFYYGFHIEEDKISDSTLSILDEPGNYKEAMASPEFAKWKEDMKSEIQSMYDNQVWNLVDTIPGLKTVGCKWIFKMKTDMDGIVRTYKARGCVMAQPEGFENANEDKSCIYVKVNGSVVVFLVLYVDDILLIRNDIRTLQSVKDWLGKCFAMKDLGDVAYILGIKIYRDRSKRLIGLNQDTYLDRTLKRFKIKNSKKGNLPLHHGIKISKDLCLKTDEELDRMSQVPYASAMGSIMYAMTYTRPDVSFAFSMKSSKQDTVADSICESEYIAACEASKEAIWMKNFIRDLGVVPIVQDPIEIFHDNESTIALTKEPKDHGKSKHVERKYHFVRRKVE
uniref:Retrotransposon protein, putative, Ty1-copia subclass n=1 Tax=Tanacetum cinerariifolium TaxID=118510 RepID=A0A6L2NV25_TANCI|nr:retrotransposon protein, putative, Ty1-copia subclass [Tanacetum cinerariifolium]